MVVKRPDNRCGDDLVYSVLKGTRSSDLCFSFNVFEAIGAVGLLYSASQFGRRISTAGERTQCFVALGWTDTFRPSMLKHRWSIPIALSVCRLSAEWRIVAKRCNVGL